MTFTFFEWVFGGGGGWVGGKTRERRVLGLNFIRHGQIQGENKGYTLLLSSLWTGACISWNQVEYIKDLLVRQGFALLTETYVVSWGVGLAESPPSSPFPPPLSPHLLSLAHCEFYSKIAVWIFYLVSMSRSAVNPRFSFSCVEHSWRTSVFPWLTDKIPVKGKLAVSFWQ